MTERSMNTNRCLLSLTLLLLLGPSLLEAGVVVTAKETFTGTILFGPNIVIVGDKEIPFADVFYLRADPSKGKPLCPNLVRMKSGEVWAGEIVAASSKKVEIRCDWLGVQSLEIDAITFLEFAPNVPTTGETKVQTLYRKLGRPLPGKLMWIEKDAIGLDSPLGSVTVKRDGLVRYALADKPNAFPIAEQDEVGLSDGNVLRGELELDGLSRSSHREPGNARTGKVVLRHTAGGTATIPAHSVAYIIRHNPSILEFTEISPQIIEVGSGELAKGKQTTLPRSLAAESPIHAMRIEPKMTIRYALPARDGKKLRFRAMLKPIGTARGDTQIKLTVGNQTVLDKTISASDDPTPLDVQLPEGDSLTIDVDFGPLLRYPCGVILEDAYLILVK
jgi:hypothetical protein